MKEMIEKLEQKYLEVAQRVLSGTLCWTEYEKALEELQSIELEIRKLQLVKTKNN